MKVTSDQVHNLLHGNSEWESWVEPLQTMLPAYDIDTPERIAMFMAQCGHESNNFRVLQYFQSTLNVQDVMLKSIIGSQRK